MQYIGIRGHRGAGKNSISYLLGRTIDYFIKNKVIKSDYDSLYKSWVDDIMNDDNVLYSADTEKVYFDSFASTLRIMLYLLMGIPEIYMKQDYYKDHLIINLKDFSNQVYDKIPSTIKLQTREDLYNNLSKTGPIVITQDTYITLREFILYFGYDIMQRFFGINVWIKSIKACENFYENIWDGYDYRIYTDVKTPSEVTYILNQNGVIVQVVRPGKIKDQGYDKLNKDGRVDFIITVSGDLMSIKDQIIDIASQITNLQ